MKKQEKKQNFLEWNNRILLNSVKRIGLSIGLIIILDILFYASAGYLILFWLQRLQAGIGAFSMPSDIMSLAPEKAQLLASEVREFYYLVIFSFILMLIAIIFLASIFKGAIWAKTTKTRVSFKLISRFLALNLVWMGFWFAVIFLISYGTEAAYAQRLMAAAIILSLYFTNTLYTVFMKNQSLKSIFYSVSLNIRKFNLFLLPYALIFLLFYAIVRIGGLVKFRYSPILLGLLLVVYAAFARYYASGLVLELEKPKSL